jgi:cyclic-di-GMP phosphodiesterase TipF (flagellum assembly factor)
MVRLGAIFVAVCIVLIAGSLGTAAYLYLGLSRPESAVLALAVLTALAHYNIASTRMRDRASIGSHLAELSRESVDLARQVGEIGRRMAVFEAKMEAAVDRTRTIADPLSAEIGELGTLVKNLAETVAAHDAAIANGNVVEAPQPVAFTRAAFESAAEAPGRPRHPAPSDLDEPVSLDNPAMVETVRLAVEAGRIDLYLQPIVTLPQRKVRYYEALSRLRTENGDIVTAADFLDYAEAGGVMAKIDNLALFRSVQVVRRLTMKNRDIGMFCNLSGSTLADGKFFPQLIDFIDANRALAGGLVFEFTQRTVRGLGPMERESLAALADRGFRFSMDRVTDLRFEPHELSDCGFRFVKVPAPLLLNRLESPDCDIHPHDLADRMSRHGVEVIASGIENEGSVVDLLDFAIRYGQGFLFSPPRPVRQEALRGVAERDEGLAHASAVSDDRPAARSAERDRGRLEGGFGQLVRGALPA